MNKYCFFIFLFLISFIGCSTLDQKEDTENKEINIKEEEPIVKLPLKSYSDNNISLKAKIKIAFPDLNQSATAKINIAHTDSLLIQVYGPLGIPVGKLFAKKDYFIMNNNLESTTYTGIPNAKTLKKLINIPLEFNDLICLLQAVLPVDVNNFKYLKSTNEEEYFEYMHTDGNELVSVKKQNNLFSKYQRNNINNLTVFNVKYKTYKNNFPNNITIEFNSLSGKVEIEYQDVVFEKNKFETLSFSKPKTYKLVNY
ncbi:MAG: DUF4292 domain-containing protein [Bacteroidetes bacterium]|nr:DUF4292 domain-containing protein [Bacteroidota bacterium]